MVLKGVNWGHIDKSRSNGLKKESIVYTIQQPQIKRFRTLNIKTAQPQLRFGKVFIFESFLSSLSLSDGGHQRRKVRLGESVQMSEDADVWFRLFWQ